MSTTEKVVARPFAKCAGGKTQLLPELMKHVPTKIARYVEPFVGGGALFFALRASGQLDGASVVLSDTNAELISAFRAIKTECGKLVGALRIHEERYRRGGAEYYYEVREQHPHRWKNDFGIAARFIFLNKTCWNGVYRINGEGRFNTPHGTRKTPPVICDAENLLACSRALRGVELRCEDFKSVLDREARRECRGTLVYADPPYVPISKTARFQYGQSFSRDEQLMLADRLDTLANRGARVVASNASCDLVRDIYEDFAIHRVAAKRAINSKGEKRGAVEELIMVREGRATTRRRSSTRVREARA